MPTTNARFRPNRSPILLLIRMNAADTSASIATADWTPLTVVSRSSTTAEIDTLMNDVSITKTNIAAARRMPWRGVPPPSSSGAMRSPRRRCRGDVRASPRGVGRPHRGARTCSPASPAAKDRGLRALGRQVLLHQSPDALLLAVGDHRAHLLELAEAEEA